MADSKDDPFRKGVQTIVDGFKEQLERAGISIEIPEFGEGKGRVKVVVVSPDLQDAVDKMGESVRDQVVMVRVDQATVARLDAWVETGAVKSRSEAAALFIREGLDVRAAELDKLKAALADVEAAKERLRQQARDVFGGD